MQMLSELILRKPQGQPVTALMERGSYIVDFLMAIKVFVPSEGLFRLAAELETDKFIEKGRGVS